jgi:hypothetical protein
MEIRKNILLIFVVSLVLLTGLSVFSDYSRMKNITQQESDSQLPADDHDCFISKTDCSGDDQLNQIAVNYLLAENGVILVNRHIAGKPAQARFRYWQPPRK